MTTSLSLTSSMLCATTASPFVKLSQSTSVLPTDMPVVTSDFTFVCAQLSDV
jgi:hypothetical protein